MEKILVGFVLCAVKYSLRSAARFCIVWWDVFGGYIPMGEYGGLSWGFVVDDDDSAS